MRLATCALAAVLLVTAGRPAHSRAIDRHALVARHAVILTHIDPHAPLMVGNGELGFTADITGLQTFPAAYAPTAPLLTMAQWAWHSFPNPNGYTLGDGETLVPVDGRGALPYAWMKSFDEAKARPALAWLRTNPHRFSLGRIALVMQGRDGRPARLADLSQTRQSLDLWSGVLTSRFVFDGQPVSVETFVHPDRDMVVAQVRSPLVASGRLRVSVSFPGVAEAVNGDPSDWDHPQRHRTTPIASGSGRLTVRRRLDATAFVADVQAPGGRVLRSGPHAIEARGLRGEVLTVAVGFGAQAPPALAYRAAKQAVAGRWRRFWTEGGAVDFSGSADPRAFELERRVVLSQYLLAINGAGDLPPQEEGLFSNSWNGKFHLEMHPWHAAWLATWGHPELLEKSLTWYLAELPRARAEARRHAVDGAWMPKMTGPNGMESPSPITPFIMWQQPHPILMAELVRRARGDAAVARYGELVQAMGELLASWPTRDPASGRYHLGPPIIPVQESHPPLTTQDPAFEVEYFRWGLQTAQAWRLRRGLPRERHWDAVIAGLAPPGEELGLLSPLASEPDFWRRTLSPECRGQAAEGCPNRDHPSMLMTYGFIGSERVDRETLRRTLLAVESAWDLRQTWGWDFPMAAMTAARLGEREDAVAWLFRDLPNNQWGVSGMTPRVQPAAHVAAFTPGASGTAEAGGDTRLADTYFPSNGALLLAVGMMAAGWDGATGPAPGFPRSGWTVRAEGLRPLP